GDRAGARSGRSPRHPHSLSPHGSGPRSVVASVQSRKPCPRPPTRSPLCPHPTPTPTPPVRIALLSEPGPASSILTRQGNSRGEGGGKEGESAGGGLGRV